MFHKQRFFAAVLTAILIAAVLSGCSGRKMSAQEVAGNYVCTHDIKDYVNDSLKETISGSAQGKELDFAFSTEMNTDFVLSMEEGGSFALSMDTDSFGNALSKAFDKEGAEFIDQFLDVADIKKDKLNKDEKADLVNLMQAQLENAIKAAENKDPKMTLSGTFKMDGSRIKFKAGDLEFTGKANSDSVTLTDSPLSDIASGEWVFDRTEEEE